MSRWRDDEVERTPLVELKGKVENSTDLSWLFKHDDTGKKVWCPRSRCTWDRDTGMMTMPEWLADKEGLT